LAQHEKKDFPIGPTGYFKELFDLNDEIFKRYRRNPRLYVRKKF
jgi:hypothetical protein